MADSFQSSLSLSTLRFHFNISCSHPHFRWCRDNELNLFCCCWWCHCVDNLLSILWYKELFWWFVCCCWIWWTQGGGWCINVLVPPCRVSRWGGQNFFIGCKLGINQIIFRFGRVQLPVSEGYSFVLYAGLRYVPAAILAKVKPNRSSINIRWFSISQSFKVLR